MSPKRSPQPLDRRRVLVVEDEYFIADDIATAIRRLGAVVVGPVGACREALELLRGDAGLDAAVLDVNLKGEMIFPVAEALRSRGIPFVLGTGYEAAALPPDFRDSPRWQKPFDAGQLARALSALIASGSMPAPAGE